MRHSKWLQSLDQRINKFIIPLLDTEKSTNQWCLRFNINPTRIFDLSIYIPDRSEDPALNRGQECRAAGRVSGAVAGLLARRAVVTAVRCAVTVSQTKPTRLSSLLHQIPVRVTRTFQHWATTFISFTSIDRIFTLNTYGQIFNARKLKVRWLSLTY